MAIFSASVAQTKTDTELFTAVLSLILLVLIVLCEIGTFPWISINIIKVIKYAVHVETTSENIIKYIIGWSV